MGDEKDAAAHLLSRKDSCFKCKCRAQVGLGGAELSLKG